MGASCCGHHGHGKNEARDHENAAHASCGHDRLAEATAKAAVPTGRGVSYRVSGLDCAEEVSILKAEIGPLVGGSDHLAFDVLNARMIVLAEGVDSAAIIDAVARTGMKAVPWSSADAGQDQDRRRKTQAILAAASGAATGLGALVDTFGYGTFGARVAFAAAILIGLWVVLPKAWLAVRRVRPDMNLLMSVAVVGAVALGDWLEAATVSFLFALSLAMESWSAGRARRAIAALMDLTPPSARVRQADGSEVDMAPDQVPVGAVFVVHPGERIPLDGRVRAGESSVDQAPITGESLPVAKAPGAEVFAGTINGDGALEVENTKAAGDTTLARVTRLPA